jgi:hypothetical protein
VQLTFVKGTDHLPGLGWLDDDETFFKDHVIRDIEGEMDRTRNGSEHYWCWGV